MKIAIVYDSSTGKTAAAAEAMGKILSGNGHQCQIQDIKDADPGEVSQADLICIGSWVKGLFIIRQHPTEGSMGFINRLDDLEGQQVVVFCTYMLAAGSTLSQMAQELEEKGANVVGRFKYRGAEPDKKFQKFAASLT